MIIMFWFNKTFTQLVFILIVNISWTISSISANGSNEDNSNAESSPSSIKIIPTSNKISLRTDIPPYLKLLYIQPVLHPILSSKSMHHTIQYLPFLWTCYPKSYSWNWRNYHQKNCRTIDFESKQWKSRWSNSLWFYFERFPFQF